MRVIIHFVASFYQPNLEKSSMWYLQLIHFYAVQSKLDIKYQRHINILWHCAGPVCCTTDGCGANKDPVQNAVWADPHFDGWRLDAKRGGVVITHGGLCPAVDTNGVR